jgi:hypothetical protein
MQPTIRLGWTRWCAAILLALLALSMLHAAAPHSGPQRDCSTCKALSSPGVAQMSGDLGSPVIEPSRMAVQAPCGSPRSSTLYLRPLRAPPAASAA